MRIFYSPFPENRASNLFVVTVMFIIIILNIFTQQARLICMLDHRTTPKSEPTAAQRTDQLVAVIQKMTAAYMALLRSP
jgi:hypothetical protein